MGNSNVFCINSLFSKLFALKQIVKKKMKAFHSINFTMKKD